MAGLGPTTLFDRTRRRKLRSNFRRSGSEFIILGGVGVWGQFEKVNVPPKLFFLTLLWEFVMFFQLKTSFGYSTDKAKVYAQKNKTSRALALI
jgi:hypothetical protein